MDDDLPPEQDLCEHVLLLLREQPQGCREYELIQQLKERNCAHIPQASMADKLVLFRTHFLVFNALYLLRERLWQQASDDLKISPLHIQLLPYAAGVEGISTQDPLREYYLDLSNLHETSENDVERLLESFWTRMRGGNAGVESRPDWDDDKKCAALELFELDQDSADLDLGTIKLRYRQLVSQHHPDRGGSTQRLQSVNLAMEILKRYYQ